MGMMEPTRVLAHLLDVVHARDEIIYAQITPSTQILFLKTCQRAKKKKFLSFDFTSLFLHIQQILSLFEVLVFKLWFM